MEPLNVILSEASLFFESWNSQVHLIQAFISCWISRRPVQYAKDSGMYAQNSI